MNYCTDCGHTLSLRVPRDDDRARHVCDHCGMVHYQNPRIVVCAVPAWEDKVLLCKRAIEPRLGLWTLPGGFMENGETTQAAALRETHEEACARIEVLDLYTLFNLPHINQVHLFYRATLLDLDFAPGRESLDVALLSEAEVPWQELAFAAVTSTLQLYFRDRKEGHFPLRLADIVLDTDNRRHIQPFNYSHDQ